MSNFDNKPLKKVTFQFTNKHQCSFYKTFKSNSYLASTLFQNDTTSDNCSNITYGVDVPSIDNNWEYYKGKYGDKYLNSHHKRCTKQKLKQHVQKLNEILF